MNLGSTEIKNFGIIGLPIVHSFSPRMYMAAFKKAGLDYYSYIPFQVPVGRLMLAVEGFKGLNFRGFNVTIPHKTEIIPYLDAVDADAMIIGAVNTVVNDDGRLTGYNTDYLGFMGALNSRKIELAGKTAVLLGAGGAARAVIWGLLQAGTAEVVLAVRNPAKAQPLAEEFSPYGKVAVCHWSEDLCAQQLKKCSLLVNTTPLGMTPKVEDCPPGWQYKSTPAKNCSISLFTFQPMK